MKSLTINGMFENCVGYARYISSVSLIKETALGSSIGIRAASGDARDNRNSRQCFVLPVPLK